MFDDIAIPILFFLSIRETLLALAAFLFLNAYNHNAALLQLGSDLFYSVNSKHKKVENFQAGCHSILACLIYQNPATLAFNYLLSKCGKNIYNYLPIEALNIMGMIGLTETYLHEHNFFQTLNDLSAMEEQTHRRVPLKTSEAEEEQVEEEVYYFPESAVKG